ncbi:unnamed protein product [Coregonus sp. 'balchen']|nr:unnamed protein product [Coregonus sp. 'balchen']
MGPLYWDLYLLGTLVLWQESERCLPLYRHREVLASKRLSPELSKVLNNVVKMAETSFSQKYKGIHFGKMTWERGEVKVVEGLGPGQYEPEEDSTAEYEKVNMRKKQKSRAESSRTTIRLSPCKKRRRAPLCPVKSTLYGSQLGCSASLILIFLAPRSPRHLTLIQKKEVVQWFPCCRCVQRPALRSGDTQEDHCLKRSLFGLIAVQLIHHSWKQSTPGPGAYNMFNYGLTQDSMKKVYLESTRKGKFSSTAQRRPVFHNKEEVNIPGPVQDKL